ncbi:hypothetical protein BFJ69_g12382 [Fusarium oxysporum]|uniref:Uncharacterized protein n=1 Tax=Fusarium oxysporum TaxID=5507 RepID=A0A420MP37_FUSOX|nr:hypothetical protein BFJ69_g12382 [Fusarium oxysporum]
MMPSNPRSFNLPSRRSVYLPSRLMSGHPFDPLGAFLSRQYSPEYSRLAILSPLCHAAVRNELEVIRFLHRFYLEDGERDIDLALFLANREGHEKMASLLLEFHANPARANSANGLHGAAWRGLNRNIEAYIETYGANPDITDGSSATPVIYAILGRQDEVCAWETIESLINYGASPWTRFGREKLSYAEIALKEGKEYLAQRFKEWEASPSPTILNSSREPSCMIGREDDGQPNNEQPREDPEVDGGASMSGESSCMPGGDNDQPDNKRPQEGSEADGGATLSRESSCTVGREDDVQPNNKRPREDPEVDGGDKRARRA